MRVDRVHPERGAGFDDGSKTEAASPGDRPGQRSGRREDAVPEKTWFKPVEETKTNDSGFMECVGGICPIPWAVKEEIFSEPDVAEEDLVNHPPHYADVRKKIETIDKIEDAIQFAPDPVLGGLQWQVLKYLDRMWLKGNPKQDAEKAKWYLDRLISKLD